MFPNKYKSAVKKALKVCKAVSNGDFEARIINIEENGAIGDLLRAINSMIDRSDAYLRETRASLDYVEANKYFRQICEIGMPGAYGDAARSFNHALEIMENNSKTFSGVISSFEGEMGGVANSLSSAADDLYHSAQSMQKSTSSANNQATQVASAAELAATNVISVVNSTQEMSQSVNEISQQVSVSSDITQAAVNEVEQANKDVMLLSESSKEIGKVVALIADIADQTNLLALNTSIEAARAGEAGKGFAVVASEVKSLATQTATATEEIGKQISNIQLASERAVNAIAKIGQTIAKIDDVSGLISIAVEKQSASTEEIAQNINQASNGTNEVNKKIANISEEVSNSDEIASNVLKASVEMSENGKNIHLAVNSFLSAVKKVV